MTTSETDPRFDSLAELALGTLPEAERPALESWLAEEGAAREELLALRESLALLAMTVTDVEPPAALRAKVLAVTGSATRAEGALPFTLRRTGGAGTALGWLAAAAAALLAVGLGWYALQLRSEVARLQADLQVSEARLAAAEVEARSNRTRLARVQAETAILSAADLRRVDLAGQKGAPRAAARAFWSRAQGLVLTATRLPALPTGRTYQLWVLTSGAPISAGIFRPDASGGTSVVFDTPVSLPAPEGMAVSVEPDGGVPAPTGDIVLAGKAE